MSAENQSTDFESIANSLGKHETPNKLAYRKSLEANAATLFSASSENLSNAAPLVVEQSTVLGVQSQYGLAKQTTDKKEQAEQMKRVTNGNPQRVDQAFLPLDHDTLIYRLTVRVNGDANLPVESGSSSAFIQHLSNIAQHYNRAGGFEYLGTLMAANIADAKFAFRNRAAELATTKVVIREASKVFEEGYEPYTETFVQNANSAPLMDAHNPGEPVTDEKVKAFGKLIGKGLAGDDLILIEVETALKIGAGQEVYPSQEMIDDSSSTAPSRVYYADADTGQAKVHSVKIGNGIRQIDIWHPEVAKYGALPAEPYGNYARRATAVRLQKNFYNSILEPEFKSLGKAQPTEFYQQLEKAQTLEDLHNIPDAHFFMAVMMRGGVFGMKEN